MKRDPGDVVDRYSIAKLKKEKVGGFEAKMESAYFFTGFLELKRVMPNV